MKIVEIPVVDILIVSNIREFDPADPEIAALAESMQASGQKVEIRVYKVGKTSKYALLVGHRRVAAAMRLGWETIRAILEDPPANEAELIMLQYNENENRENLTYIERAHVFLRLKNAGWTQRQIAESTGTSDADVSLALATLRTPGKIQQAVNDGRLSPSAVEPILSLPARDQEELAAAVIQAKTVRNVKKVVDAHNEAKKASKEKRLAQTEVPDDADPMELISLSEIDEAIEHLRSANETPITNHQLVRAARPKVEELIRMAARLKNNLDGYTWDDTKDLL